MGLKRTLLGGPAKEDSASLQANHGWDMAKDRLSHGVDYIGQGGDMMAGLLGSNGNAAQVQALENFSNSGGMNFLREQGNKQITSNKAASGLLKSGSFGTALEKYGQGLGSTYLNQFMEHANNLGKLGVGTASVMSDMGRYGKSESDKEGEKKGLIPQAAQFAMMI